MAKLYDSILRPSYIMLFGINYGLSLAEIYQYSPFYIEWLIINVPKFEIDPDEFESLPNPTVYDSRFGEDNFPDLQHKRNVNLIKRCGKLKVITFNFSQKARELLRKKAEGTYKKEEGFERPRSLSIKSLIRELAYYNQQKTF